MFSEKNSSFEILLILVALISFGFAVQYEKCNEILKIEGNLCGCYQNIYGYFIYCDYLQNNSSNFNGIIQIEPFKYSRSSIIDSLKIVNRNLKEINERILINTTLCIFELYFINDSIEFISPQSSLSNFVNLTKLVINQNPLRFIDLVFISELNHLETLDLSKNRLASVNFQALAKLTNLAVLDLSNNIISEIEPGSFRSLINLEKLYLDHNRLTSLGSGLFAGLFKLTDLKLEGNKLVKIMSHTFDSLNSLTRLDLSYQNIKRIESEAIINCSHLNYLSLEGNQLQIIQSGFLSHLAEMEELDFSDNLISELQRDFFMIGMKNVKTLFLRKNILRSIKHGSFVDLNKLELLALNKNHFRDLDSEMFIGLEKLTYLDVSDNNIAFINAFTFSHLPNLIYLYLERNFITSIEPFAFSKLTNLNVLNLNDNYIVEIFFNAFFDLKRLISLNLNNNRISKIAKSSFVDLSNLKTIFLQSNDLRSIDSNVFDGVQSSLKTLDLSANKLENTDDPLSNLFSLDTLSLNSNRIHKISKHSFENMTKLNYLDLANNPLERSVDQSVFEKLLPQLSTLNLSNIGIDPSKFLNLSFAPRYFYLLDLSNTPFRIESNTLKAIAAGISKLHLRRIGLRRLINLPMNEMIDLNVLDLSSNPLDWSAFSPSSRFFKYHPSLSEVNLSNTSIVDLRSVGLNDLLFLTSLDLSSNLIETIEPGIFNSDCFESDACFSLKLTNNRIKFIQPGSFDKIKILKNLAVDRNSFYDDLQLTHINAENLAWLTELIISYSNLTQLLTFEFLNTDIDDDGNLDSYQLETLRLDHNNIESIGSKYFEKLQELSQLDLSHNQIWKVESSDVFYGNLKLTHLNLSSNRIDSQALGRINFDLCVNLEKLDLSHNRIDVIESFLFNGLKKLKIIELSSNSLIRIEAKAFNSLTTLRELFFYDYYQSSLSFISKSQDNRSTLSNLILKEKFINNCDQLKIVHISSIDLVRYNLASISTSLKAVIKNKKVNSAIYYNSINIKLQNYDYYQSDFIVACKLTLELLKQRIHLNLLDDLDFNEFFLNCSGIDFFLV